MTRALAGLTACAAAVALVWSAPAPVRAASPDTAPPLPAPTGTVVQVATESQLRAAVANLSSGTTIVIAPGTYALTNTLWVNRAVSDVVIRGATNNRDDVVLVGKGMAAATDGGVPFGIWTGGSVTRVTIANLTIKDVFFHPIIFNAGTQQPRVYNVRLVDAGQQFLKANPDGQGGGVNGGVVEYCVMEYTTAAKSDYTNAVDVHTGQNWVIRHNLFRRIRSNVGLAGPAVLMWNDSRNTVVEGNTFIDNHRDIHLGLIERTPNDHTGGVVRNNMIVRSSGAGGDVGIGVFDSPGTVVAHNTVWMGGAYHNAIEYRFVNTTGVTIANNLSDARVTARDGATATVSGNVLSATAGDFVSVPTGDLHLSASASSAIDKVAVRPDTTTDWDGQTRPAGGAADVGADERTSVVVPPGPTEICGDGIDNDGDGLIDEGCPTPPSPPAVELCGDGRDNDADGLVDEQCAGLGTPLAVGVPARFAARARGTTITFEWLAPITGGPVTGYLLDVGLSPGTTAARVPVAGRTSIGVPNVGPGTYYARVRAVGPAGEGAASAEAAVTVGPCPAFDAPAPLTAFLAGSRLTLEWTDAHGCDGRAFRLMAGSQSGSADLAVLPLSGPRFEASVPTGQFFLRVASETGATSNEVRVNVAGGCPAPAFAIGLSGRSSGGVLALQWYPQPDYAASALDAATPLAYVLEAGTAPGAADIGVLPVGRTASFTAAAPPGRYYLRVRASSMCGLGPASNDVLVTTS